MAHGSRRFATAGLASLTVMLTLMPAATSAQDSEVTAATEAQVRSAVAVRAAYGLSADPAFVVDLMESDGDVGTSRWGIPLTSGEAAALDLDARMRYADKFAESVAPIVRPHPAYAGMWFDQLDGGRGTVALTRGDPALLRALAAADPDPSGSLTIKLVERTYTELQAAAERAADALAQIAPGLAATGFGVDEVGNGIKVFVDQGTTVPTTVQAGLASRLGVPVSVVEEPVGADTACTDRDHCTDPMREGIRILRENDNYDDCTLGWIISKGTDELFVTAGHCGYGGDYDWYHKGYGRMGNEGLTLYANGGKDIMRVGFPDAQASTRIYGMSGTMVHGTPRLPILNEQIWNSGSKTNAILTGTVTDTWRSWTSETANYTVWGGDTSLTTIKGDSGAPLFSRSLVDDGYWIIKPIGVTTHQNGYFARLSDALSAWGDATIYNP